MTSKERHEARYQRRKAKREEARKRRTEEIGGIEEAMSYHELFKAGIKCCNGVRWKNSVQRFEMHLFSGTAVRHRQVLQNQWKPFPYVHFTLCERGKVRPIDAPRIQDRQVHKAFTRNVLLPLYLPSMIYNNGASLPGKGFHFSLRQLADELRDHYRKYGREGHIILIDFKQFFPSAPHSELYKRHRYIIQDPQLCWFADTIVNSVPGGIGMPLGVEPSQAEMIALPSAIDNYVKCQLSMDGAGHYMDDYYILVPPDQDALAISIAFTYLAKSMGLTISPNKTRIVPLTKPFRYCKAKFRLTETGKVIINGNPKSTTRARHKAKAFQPRFFSKEMPADDLFSSLNSSIAYLNNYDDHNKVLEFLRLCYSLYGCSLEKIEYIRQRSLLLP